MITIGIGDPSSGWTLLEGEFVSPPIKQAAAYFSYSAETIVSERIEIQLAGSAAQISEAITKLQLILQRVQAYNQGDYPSPQCLRFQPVSPGTFYNAQILTGYLETNPAGYLTHASGSLVIMLHYTRPNYFDADPVELALSGRAGSDITGGFTLYNHTDDTAAHGNTALIKKTSFATDLPAPLRIEYTYTPAVGNLRDLFIGAYHHPSHDSETPFFCQSTDITGGSQIYDANAINDYYCRLTWSATTWTALCSYAISLTNTNILDGRTYRPFVYLFNAHAYDDLHLKIQLQRGSDVLCTCDPIYAAPGYGYVLFPPIEIPPSRLMREQAPHHVEIVFYAQKDSIGTYTLDIDQIMLLPLDYAATFLGFFNMTSGDTLVYDNHRELYNVRYSTAGSETIAHVLQGGPLMLYPESNTRLFFTQAAANNIPYINRTASLRVYYRKRVTLL